MEGIQSDDPFLWDVDAVVEHLCRPGSVWARDPAALSSRIAEEEVDGKTLLTYEHLCSRQELMECLGVKPARHKAALEEAIIDWRHKSRAYHRWKQELVKKQSEALAQDWASSATNHEVYSTQVHAVVGRPHDNCQDDKAAHTLSTNSHAAKDAHTSPQAHQPDRSSAVDDGKPRKRIAPITLQNEPLSKKPRPIPTEADIADPRRAHVIIRTPGSSALPWETRSSGAYLGAGAITYSDIKSPHKTLSTRLLDVKDDKFVLLPPNSLPSGRQLVVCRTMIRLFRANNCKIASLLQGKPMARSPTPTDDGDPVIAWSDLPDSWDEETMREIEAEELEEEQQRQARSRQYLSRGTVERELSKAIEGLTSAWEQHKLPKLERKAWKLWNDARRKGLSKAQILENQKQAKFFDDRIKKLCDAILDESWTKAIDIERQARSLEQNLADKLCCLWRIQVLEKRQEPPRVHHLPRLQTKPPARAESPSSGEELASSDGEDDAEFVVPDDDLNEEPMQVVEQTPNVNDHFEISPVKSDMYVDLTQMTPTPKTSRFMAKSLPSKASKPEFSSQPVLIDLVSPDKLGGFPSSPPAVREEHDTAGDPPPSMENFGSLEETKNLQPQDWARQGDRWRMISSLLWKLNFAQRKAVLDVAQEADPDMIWDKTIQRQISEPLLDMSQLENDPVATAAFYLTHLFLCFIRCKAVKKSQVAALSERSKNMIRERRDTLFEKFLSFINMIAPGFPQAEQLYRVEMDDLEDDEAADIDADDGLLPSSQNNQSQTRKTKEIIQNKAALDIRQREKQRFEEQEARRVKLRANLANSTGIPSDRSRLIINESKQDDQPFIYVSDGIGKRIKDHQIEGVRFLWNQIVLDPDSRQGCLLAHSMGLGKTMQVITLLVAIAEAAASTDESVRAQIPKELRESKTLILCPSGLVDNWMDELLGWTLDVPDRLLGPFRKVESTMGTQVREDAVMLWAKDGGILVVGYNMFQNVIGISDEVMKTLTESPNIVIADEAHKLKNPAANISKACSLFRTRSRIALTGSPLANNVEEYHAMIDWVAPNYLGPHDEFRDRYARPIHQGLWGDSTGVDKRRALKVLQALKETVAPKVHRATTKSCLKDDLPPKQEYVIIVAPTPMQRRLYKSYVEAVRSNRSGQLGQSRIWSVVDDLSLICNHPKCFKVKAQQVNGNGQDNPIQFPREIIPSTLKETKIPDIDNASLSTKSALLILILDEARAAGDKVLIFSSSKLTLDYLENLLRMQRRRCCRLDGSTAISKRQTMVKQFNTGNQEVYLISTTAGGVGLNIQGANRVVIFDFEWNPVNEQQAIGRAYRIGQKKPVSVYWLLVGGSFEEDMHNKAVFKMQLASRVVDKKNPISWGKRLGGFLHDINPVPAKDIKKFMGKDRILDKLISYKDNGEAILSIVSTDTFEEEDVTIDLTQEERQEAANMVSLNRLRLVDPAEYERQKHSALLDNRIAVPEMLHAPNSVNRTMDGASDVSAGTIRTALGKGFSTYNPTELRAKVHGNIRKTLPFVPQPTVSPGAFVQNHDQQHTQPPRHGPSPVPIPMAGANTFFGRQHEQQTGSHQNSNSQQSSTQTSVQITGRGTPTLFSQPKNQAMEDFRAGLSSRMKLLQEQGYPGTQGPRDRIANTLTLAIDQVRKEHSFGFLHDNQHWKFLHKLLNHDRFVVGMVAGHLTPRFLGLADKTEMDRRIEVLEGLSEIEFRTHLGKGAREPEPLNLENIDKSDGHSSSQAKRSLRQDDLKVMQEAAEKRKYRSSVRLPGWANEALSAPNGRAGSSGRSTPSGN
ncbi:hypothetical protein S40285_01191 [Stachybotrys chlorohalonatus IBT 40285]|uniref:Uncharacterized protein n=1 Tax=Stachybotrys chlorohalonatus (strain IBT 40285) TaxID=1283841 RepID=A0A084QXT1_STAC4|nr:hypothetical protein S40285_01191 [Stachybotrys chlorohalonata IBT 40285]